MELINTDCEELLKTIPSNSIDLIITDPPYNIGFDGGRGWDTVKDYLEWCQKWTKECSRVLKNNRMLCVFGTLKTNEFIIYKLQTERDVPKLKPQEEIIWSYNWGGRKKTNFARKHEYIWCWSNGDSFLFNADAVRVPRKVSIGEYKHDGTIPTCVWEKNNHTTSKEYCKWHPTQKPLMILERLIKAYSNEDDTVLDIFSGSGSTAIAAINTNRKFIGSELDPEYYEKSLIRIKELTNV